MISPIGIFDSGLGGFTVLNRLLNCYGDVPCVYLGDTARLPYGNKETAEIRQIAKEVINWLTDKKISLVVVACNTTNSLALDVIYDFCEVPVFDLIGSATEMIHENRIGILSTPATAASNAYSKNIKQRKPGTFVIEQACPAFVPMIEAEEFNSDDFRRIAIQYLKPLLSQNVEAIVLGCSHYPLLEKLFMELVPSDVRLIDPAVGLVSKLKNFLLTDSNALDNYQKFRNTRIFVTSDPNDFSSRAEKWFGNCPDVELISLRSNACFF